MFVYYLLFFVAAKVRQYFVLINRTEMVFVSPKIVSCMFFIVLYNTNRVYEYHIGVIDG